LKNDHQRNFSRPRLPLPTCHAGILHLMWLQQSILLELWLKKALLNQM
jgi:hypothetical protein